MATASSKSARSRSSAGALPSAAFISTSIPSANATKVRSRCTALTASFSKASRSSADIVDDLIEFVKNAEVIIHNAEFDIEFLDAELTRIGRSRFADHCLRVICSLQHAREQHPGKRNSLDALCERYAVSNAHRTLHGALLDAGLLADVFLAMTRGQDSLVIDVLDDDALTANFGPIDVSQLIAVAVADEEVAAHEALLDLIAREAKVTPVWRLIPAHA